MNGEVVCFKVPNPKCYFNDVDPYFTCQEILCPSVNAGVPRKVKMFYKWNKNSGNHGINNVLPFDESC